MSHADPVYFRDLPILLDEDTLWTRLRVREGSGETETVRGIINRAKAAARPRGVVRQCQVEEHFPGGVGIAGETFYSRLLRWQFDNVDTVYAFVLTAGSELAAINPPDEELLERFWWDEVKTAIMRGAHRAMQEQMAQLFGTAESMAYLSPGSGDIGFWSVADQPKIFQLLGDVESMIGVQLTPSCCMIPRHSISGLHYPRSSEFVTCKVCQQASCPDRLAPFDPELWKRLKNSE